MDLINVLTDYCVNLLGDPTTKTGGIPEAVGNLISMAVTIIQVVVPILLIIWGMLDFAKSVVAQDEEKTKAGQKVFMKRLIAAAVCFLIVTIVQLVINIVGSVGGEGNESGNAWSCAKDLINGTHESDGQ